MTSDFACDVLHMSSGTATSDHNFCFSMSAFFEVHYTFKAFIQYRYCFITFFGAYIIKDVIQKKYYLKISEAQGYIMYLLLNVVL
jgi:hypothetical protein